MKKLLLFLLLLPALCQAASEPDSLTLFFHLYDGITREELPAAQVFVRDAADSTLLATERRSYLTEEKYGEKKILQTTVYARVPRRPAYLVRVELAAYEPEQLRVDVPARQFIKVPTREWHVNVNLFRRRVYELGEAVVRPTRILMVTKGDTIEYDADALQMADGDMLSHLVNALPGAEITDEGQIKVNGQFVSRLLVGGREFFAGDPQVALRNLPAYTVKKIQVYHDASFRQAEPGLDHARPQETDPLVMDVRLKRQFEDSWLAHFNAAGGRETGHGGQWLYRVRLFAMRFTKRATLVLYGNANNFNDQSEPLNSQGTSWGYANRRATDGVSTLQSGGFSLSFADKVGANFYPLNYNTSIRAERARTELATRTAAESFMEGGNTYSRSRYANTARRFSLRWTNYLTYKFGPASYLTVQNVRFDYDHASSRSFAQAAELGADPQTSATDAVLDSLFSPVGSTALSDYVVNRRQQTALGRHDGYSATADVRLFLQEPWWGRQLEVDVSGNFLKRKEQDYVDDALRYGAAAAGGYRQDRYTRLDRQQYDYAASLELPSYAKAFGRRASFSAALRYGFAQRHRQGERALYRLDSLAAWAPDSVWSWSRFDRFLSAAGPDLARAVDQANTYHTTEDEKEHTLTPSLNLRVAECRLAVSVPLRFRRSFIRDYRALTPRSLSRHDFLAGPEASFTYRKFGLTYRYTEEVPALLRLLPVREDSDPLRVSLGNPDLRNAQTHSLSASWSYDGQAYKRSANVSARYEKRNRQVDFAQAYDRATGRRTSMPLNVDGTWGSSLSLSYAQYLDRAEKFRLDVRTNAGLTHNVGFLTDTEVLGQGRQAVDNLLWDGNLELRCYLTDRTRLTGRADFAWRYMDSDRPDFTTLRTTDFSYSLELDTQLPGRIDLWTEIAMNSRRGYLDASMNDDCLVWNASLSRSFGRKREWVVALTGRDLLQQVSNVRRTLDALGRTETHYNTLSAYFMLSLTYQFKPKAKAE